MVSGRPFTAVTLWHGMVFARAAGREHAVWQLSLRHDELAELQLVPSEMLEPSVRRQLFPDLDAHHD